MQTHDSRLAAAVDYLLRRGWQVVVKTSHPELANYLDACLKAGKTILLDEDGDVLLKGDRGRNEDAPWMVSGHRSQWGTAMGALWALKQLGR